MTSVDPAIARANRAHDRDGIGRRNVVALLVGTLERIGQAEVRIVGIDAKFAFDLRD